MKMQLAPEQSSVVFAGAEDVFVAAAAGSGKTRVLVARFVAAVLGEIPLGPCAVTDVLAVTFTDKAAGEIAERVRATLLAEGRGAEARQVEQSWVSTIHGMCSKILRRHAFEAGLDPQFALATQVDASILEQEAFESALRGLVEVDEGVERLVVDFGTSRVAAMASAVHGALRSMGRSVSDVKIAALPDENTVRQWHATFEEIADRYPTLGQGKTIESSAAAARTCADAIERSFSIQDIEQAAAAVLETLAAASFPARGSQDVKDLAAEAKACVAETSGGFLQVLARPYEDALLRAVAGFGARYEELKMARGMLDFEDLQLKTAVLLESHPKIAERYQRAFRLVMIDEFQDTNALQLRIAGALSANDLLTVGDDKQSIYRFRHADVEVFRSLARRADKVHVLRSNYRSHAEVVGAINEIFDTPTFFAGDFVRLDARRSTTEPYPWPSEEPRVEFLLTDGRDAKADDRRTMEATAIAQRLAELRAAGIPQGDMVVLTRAMKGRAEGIEAALRAADFDVYVASGGTYFDRPEIEEVTALLSAIDNPRNDEALMRVLAGRLISLSEDALYHISVATPRGRRLWDTLTGPEIPEMAEEDVCALGRAVAIIERLRERRGRRGIAELIHEACEHLDYDLVLFASGPDGPRAWANVLKLGRLAEEYERRQAGDLSGFLHHVALHRELAPETQATLTGEGLDAVRIMSIHAAKGLEFPVVVVADLASAGNTSCGEVLLGRDESPLLAMRLSRDIVPDGPTESTSFTALKSAETEQELAESDRLLYVACTRARECLILSATVSMAKPAESACDMDRLRRAARIAVPAGELAPTATLGAGVSVAVRLETIALPEHSICAAIEMPAAGCLPAVQDQHPEATPGFVPRDVSYTALAVYKECPQKFYARYIARLKTPQVRQGDDPLAFGSAVHAALQLSVSGAIGSDRLAAIARAHRLDDSEVGRLGNAIQMYAESEIARAVTGADRTIRECPFMVPLKETLLRGSLDLLAWKGSEATVIDYKTGAADLSPEEARQRYQAQAECYGLAVLRAGASRASVRFVEIERGCRETRFEFEHIDADAIEAALNATVTAIGRGEFQSLSTFTAGTCDDCPALGGTCAINPRRGAAV